jgi:hypothetical protein
LIVEKTELTKFSDEALEIFYRHEASKLADKIGQLINGFPMWQGVGALCMSMGRIMAQLDDDNMDEMFSFIRDAIIEELAHQLEMQELTEQREPDTENSMPH